MRALEIDDLLAVHRRLITRGVIAPLAEDDVEVRRWLDWELASLIEGHFHRIVEVGALSAAERAEWERRVTEGGLRDPRTDKWRRVYWLLHDGEPVGTLGLDVTRLGRPDVGLTSLYVRPDLRRHRIAAQALDEVFDAAVAGGATGLRLETSWSWQAAVRFYLALGFWVRNWKHALAFMRSTALCPYRVEMHGMQATFLVPRARSKPTAFQAVSFQQVRSDRLHRANEHVGLAMRAPWRAPMN
ncbi:MAG: GNAT family N-acetyltransferase, partial [Acidobacteria bacterium]|nr:GNAT family N-acetyltransferase [Acidobacteriota bacterium]